MKIPIGRILWGVDYSRIPKSELELIKFHEELAEQTRVGRKLKTEKRRMD